MWSNAKNNNSEYMQQRAYICLKIAVNDILIIDYKSVNLTKTCYSLLTLGAHAQRGLQQLSRVCVCVCVCVCMYVCMSVRTRYSGSTRN